MRVDLTMKDRGLTNKIWGDKHPKWTLLPLPWQPETPQAILKTIRFTMAKREPHLWLYLLYLVGGLEHF
jgi:hypothetical protein